ncbi:MAG: hypothetical protein F2529_00400 [Actinobacteria bacterium]|uniref:Unannotated protein n=1 Tax=freshwater metagenome TaxID=449393 RepID=A0A6J6B5W2_9ZZZZ|nr:hypothetical protein [Actinomycetota bacterium]MTA29352.1 hypothetical protein [Actinomycetota bacterium]
MSELRHLVEALRGLSDAALRSLVATRLISVSTVEDFYALAESLNHPKSFAAQIGSLSKKQLDTIAQISKGEKVSAANAAGLLELQLIYRVDSGFKVFENLLDQLKQHKTFTRALTVINLDEVHANQSEIDRDAGLVAFETMQALTEIIFDLEKHLIREVGKSGVGLPDVKRLGAALAKPNDFAKRMFSLASRLGLMTIENSRHRLTPPAVQWLSMDQQERISLLVENFKALLGSELCSNLNGLTPGSSLKNWLTAHFPLAENTSSSRIGQILDFAESFGLTFDHFTTSWFTDALANRKSLASHLQKHLPTVQKRIILQADLSIIAPGPLPTKLEVSLRRFATTETISLASTYRLSALSICHGLETGLKIDEIRDFLKTTSAAKLPQPVEYLLNEVTARFGRLVVTEVADNTERSLITSPDNLLLTEIGNDPRLRAFSLSRPSPEQLTCRFESSVVYFGLRECGYLAIRRDQSGAVISPVEAAEAVAGKTAASSLDSDLARIRAADAAMSAGGNDEAITRQVQLAIRNKARLLITATIADGSSATFDLMPNGIANGRLRGLDRKAQIERTLPLSTITAITLA